MKPVWNNKIKRKARYKRSASLKRGPLALEMNPTCTLHCPSAGQSINAETETKSPVCHLSTPKYASPALEKSPPPPDTTRPSPHMPMARICGSSPIPHTLQFWAGWHVSQQLLPGLFLITGQYHFCRALRKLLKELCLMNYMISAWKTTFCQIKTLVSRKMMAQLTS